MREPRTWSKRKSRPSRARALTRVNTCIFRFFFWMYGYRFSFVTRETRVVFSFLVIFKDPANPHHGSIPYFSLGTVRVSRDKYVSILVIIQWGETFVGRGACKPIEEEAMMTQPNTTNSNDIVVDSRLRHHGRTSNSSVGNFLNSRSHSQRE